MEQVTTDLKTIWNDVKDYLNIKKEQFRLMAIEKVAKLMADLVSTILLIVCFIMAFLAACITLAFYLSDLLKSYTKGFGLAAIAFILLAIIVGLIRDKYLEKWIADFTVRRYFAKHCEGDDCDEEIPAVEVAVTTTNQKETE